MLLLTSSDIFLYQRSWISNLLCHVRLLSQRARAFIIACQIESILICASKC